MIRKIFFAVVPVLALALAAPAQAFVPTYSWDASALGKGNMELFFALESASDAGGDSTELRTYYIYGLDDNWNLWGELPLLFDNGAGESGLGDVTVGAKWSFHKIEDWSLALSPYLTLATGSSSKGMGSGETNLGGILIASWAQDRSPWAVNLNLDLFTNNGGSDELGWALSAEGEYSLDDFWTLVGELTTENDGFDNSDSLLFGASYAVNEDVEVGGGLRLGLSDYAPDTVIVIGVTVSL